MQRKDLLDCFLTFAWVPVGCLRSCVGMLGGGLQECSNCWACEESVEDVLIVCASHDSKRLILLTI